MHIYKNLNYNIKVLTCCSIVDNWSKTKVMSAYLIHSLPLKMSAIQIFVGDKMACVSHLVGEDTIAGEKKLELDGAVGFEL